MSTYRRRISWPYSGAAKLPFGALARRLAHWRGRLAAILLILGGILVILSRHANISPFEDFASALFPNTLAAYASRLNFNVGTQIGELFGKKTALSQRGIDLVASEYKGMTVNFEDDWAALEPQEGQDNFAPFDNNVSFASRNDLTLNYAHLLWPTYPPSYPDWIFPNSSFGNCGTRTRAELRQILTTHIQRVITHAGSSTPIVSWNVANEAFNERGELQQNNCFYIILGEYYIDALFHAARAATSSGTLILNEYFQSDSSPSGINLDKVDGFFNYVRAAKARGVPIDAVGIQNHLISASGSYFGPNYPVAFQHILDEARDAGVKLMITEMDVYQGSRTQDDVKRVYEETLSACLRDKNCVWFSTWGISDSHSWLHLFDMFVNPEPLLFDGSYQKKPAYYGVLEALQEGAAR